MEVDLKPAGLAQERTEEVAKQVRSARHRRLNGFGGDHVTEKSMTERKRRRTTTAIPHSSRRRAVLDGKMEITSENLNARLNSRLF